MRRSRPCKTKVKEPDVPTSKLSRRLFILTSLALLPAAAITVYHTVATRLAREQELHKEAAQAGKLASLELRRIVDGLEQILFTVASAPSVQDIGNANCTGYITRLSKSFSQFAGLAVTDAKGIVWCGQNGQGLGVSLADRSYFTDAARTGRFAVGTYTVGRITHRKVLPVAYPIRNERGEVSGTVVASLDLGWLGSRVREREFTARNALTIADRNGVILAREPFPERFVGTEIPAPYKKLVSAREPGTIEVLSQDGTQRILGYEPATVQPSGLYVSAGIATAEAFADIRRTTYGSAAIAALGIALAYLLTWWTSRKLIQQPVGRLVQTVTAWRSNQEDVRANMTERDGEFGIVGQAIDSYMDELIAARDQRLRDEQKRELLAGELDHRVKNILATVQAIARQTFPDRDAEDVQEFNRRIGALSSAHHLLLQNEWQNAEIQKLVEAILLPFDTRQPSAFSVSGPSIVLNSSATLALSMALHELSTNAAKYGALKSDQGHISLTWYIKQDGDEEKRFYLTWTESGGPPVSVPTRKGFGSRMIERVLTSQLHATVQIDYPSTGLSYEMHAPLEQIEAETPVDA